MPTIAELKDKYNLYLLCLSTGNYDGLGKIRSKEFNNSAKYLEFTGSNLIDHKDL